MTAEIIDLRGRLCTTERTVSDTLRVVADMIDRGEIKPDLIYVAMREQVPNTVNELDYIWSTNSHSRFERVGLLARHLHLANEQ